jgi:Phosphotransferase enzyme family
MMMENDPALAEIHALMPRANTAIFQGQPPWILSFHLVPRGSMQSLSAANGQFMSILQSYPDFGQALDRIRAGWRRNALIHGDMKFDNVVVRGAQTEEQTLYVVDWELADTGDSAWDVASILQAYLTWWIGSLESVPGGGPGDAAQYPLETIPPAIRAFWKAYVSSRRFGVREADEELERGFQTATSWLARGSTIRKPCPRCSSCRVDRSNWVSKLAWRGTAMPRHRSVRTTRRWWACTRSDKSRPR